MSLTQPYAIKQPTPNQVAQAVWKLLRDKLDKFERQGQLATKVMDIANRTGRMEAAAEIMEDMHLELNKLFLS